jgi:hypothetical protein
MAALRASAACAPHTPPPLLPSISAAAAEALHESILAGNAHLFQAALAGLQLCGSDSVQAVVDELCMQNDSNSDIGGGGVVDGDSFSCNAPKTACASITSIPTFSCIVSQALSPSLPLSLPLSPPPPPSLENIQYPFSVSSRKAAESLEGTFAAAAVKGSSSRVMCVVGPSFTNPAQAIISLLLSVPGVSAFRGRESLEIEFAALLHEHISSAAKSLPKDDQNQQKLAKILVGLKPKAERDDVGQGTSFDGISWHRLLVRQHTFQLDFFKP